MDLKDVLYGRGTYQKGHWPYCPCVCIESCFPLSHAMSKLQGGGASVYEFVNESWGIRVIALRWWLKRSLRYGMLISLRKQRGHISYSNQDQSSKTSSEKKNTELFFAQEDTKVQQQHISEKGNHNQNIFLVYFTEIMFLSLLFILLCCLCIYMWCIKQYYERRNISVSTELEEEKSKVL